MKRIALFASLTAFVLSQASQASAQTGYYADSTYPVPPTRDLTAANAVQASFLSLFVATGTDHFESYGASYFDLALGPVFVPPPPVYSVTGIPVTYTSTAPTVGTDYPAVVVPFPFSVSHSQFLSGSAGAFVPLSTNFTFSTRVNGFGAFFIQLGDGSNSNTVTITLQDGANTPRVFTVDTTLVTTGTSNGSGTANVFSGRNVDAAFYLGIFDTTPFDKVTVTTTDGGDGILFDDLSVGLLDISAIPEPSTYALIGGLGLAGMGGYFYKRRRTMKKQDQRFGMAR